MSVCSDEFLPTALRQRESQFRVNGAGMCEWDAVHKTGGVCIYESVYGGAATVKECRVTFRVLKASGS